MDRSKQIGIRLSQTKWSTFIADMLWYGMNIYSDGYKDENTTSHNITLTALTNS